MHMSMHSCMICTCVPSAWSWLHPLYFPQRQQISYPVTVNWEEKVRTTGCQACTNWCSTRWRKMAFPQISSLADSLPFYGTWLLDGLLILSISWSRVLFFMVNFFSLLFLSLHYTKENTGHTHQHSFVYQIKCAWSKNNETLSYPL